LIAAAAGRPFVFPHTTRERERENRWARDLAVKGHVYELDDFFSGAELIAE
jgi:hypothetical protein